MTFPRDPHAPITKTDRIRRGDFDPFATGADGRDSSAARATARVLDDELDSLARDDARREDLEAQRTAWLDRAAILEELGR